MSASTQISVCTFGGRMAEKKVSKKKVVYCKPGHYKDFLDEDDGGLIVNGPSKWDLMMSTFDHWAQKDGRPRVFHVKLWGETQELTIRGRIEAIEPHFLINDYFSITFVPEDFGHDMKVYRFNYNAQTRSGNCFVCKRIVIPLKRIEWGGKIHPREMLGD